MCYSESPLGVSVCLCLSKESFPCPTKTTCKYNEKTYPTKCNTNSFRPLLVVHIFPAYCVFPSTGNLSKLRKKEEKKSRVNIVSDVSEKNVKVGEKD